MTRVVTGDDEPGRVVGRIRRDRWGEVTTLLERDRKAGPLVEPYPPDATGWDEFIDYDFYVTAFGQPVV